MTVTLAARPDRLSSALVRALRTALGPEHVLDDEAVSGHVDPYAFSPAVVPAAVALPASVEEVRAVLRECAAHATPVWTVSRGRNYGYGGASPRVPGSVVLDLSRMTGVEVDEDGASVLVEPGVSFLDLHAQLRASGSSLWPSVPDIGWGSVVGNTLERGFGYTAHGDHAAHQCGLEAVLADGTVVRTGMGAKAGATTWQAYKGGYGPSLDGLFMQSNLGVVTKMGLWMKPQPERAAACMVRVKQEADLARLVDVLHALMLDGVVQSNAVIGNAPVIASMISDRPTWWPHDGPITDEGVRRIMAGIGLGFWNARFGLYGPAELVEARLKLLRRTLAAALPDAELTVNEYAGDVDPADVHPADRAQLGVPSTDLVRMAAWRGGEPAHIDFSLVCRPSGAEAVRYMRTIRAGVEAHGFDYAGGFTLFPRHAIALALVSFDKSDAAQTHAVRDLFPALIRETSAMGAAPYRSHLAFMDLTASQYDWGDHALMRVAERIKDALDPSGLLSPGKQGVWPRHRREAFLTAG